MTKRRLFVLLNALSVVLIGCGDNGSGSDDTGSTTSQGQDTEKGTDTHEAGPTSTEISTDTHDTSESDTPSQTNDPIGTDPADYVQNFDRYTVAKSVSGAAFAVIADVNGNGVNDIVVSCFGPLSDLTMKGEVVMFSMGSSLNDWVKSTIVPKSINISFPGAVTVRDMDNDGDMDVFLPSGFLACQSNPLAGNCGALNWFEQTPDGGWIRHSIANNQPLFYHRALFADLNDDGLEDLLTVGEKKPAVGASSAKVQIFFGDNSDSRFSGTPVDIGPGLGSLPELFDIDGDGDLDILSAEYFHNNGKSVSFAWYEQIEAPSGNDPGTWTRHVIADDLGPSIQLTLVPNLYGDNVLRAIGSNHSNTNDNANAPESQVALFEIPSNVKSKWTYTKISQGIVSKKSPFGAPQGAPGVFAVGDVDGDGDLDVAVSGDGDSRVFLLEQVAPGQWRTHVMHDNMGQAGAAIGDVDGDGNNEIVFTSYEENIVQVFKWKN
jgi:hypothetical protein